MNKEVKLKARTLRQAQGERIQILKSKFGKKSLLLLLSFFTFAISANESAIESVQNKQSNKDIITLTDQEIDYLGSCKTAQVYLSKELKEAFKLIDESKINNKELSQIIDICKNCNFVDKEFAYKVVVQVQEYLNRNNNEQIANAINNYKLALDNNDALVNINLNDANRATSSCLKQQFVCNLLVRDLTACNSILVQENAATTPIFDVNTTDNTATFNVPVTIRFPSRRVSGVDALTVIGVTDLRGQLHAREFAHFFKNVKIDGNLRVDGRIISGGQTVVTNAANVGTGDGQVFQSKTGETLNFRTLEAGSNVNIATNADTVTINATGSGDVTNAANDGTGAGLFNGKTGSILHFKSLTAGNNIALTENANDVEIATINSGNVTGPNPSTLNAIATYGNTTGTLLLDNPGVTITGNNINTTGNLELSTNPSTTTAGNITKGGTIFISNLGSTTNTYVGLAAGDSTTIGLNNTAVGQNALTANTLRSDNTAIGFNALALNTLGLSNTAVGSGALDANTSGIQNTAVGKDALGSGTTAQNNVAVGSNAAQFVTTGGSNVAIGQSALGGGSAVLPVTGSNNIAIGATAMGSAQTTGSNNIGIGLLALRLVTTGTQNVGIGNNTLFNITTNSDCVAVGHTALQSNTAAQITAVGASALSGNTSATGNTAVGYRALAVNSNAAALNNTAIGHQALDVNLSGTNNTALGKDALGSNNTGSNNIGIGNNGGGSLTTGSNNIHIGNTGVAAETTTIKIGIQGTQTRTFISGIRGATTGVADAIAVLIDSNGQLGTVSSSLRYKKNIENMADDSSNLLQCRPVKFSYKTDENNTKEFGLIAEEVAQVMPELVVHDKEGNPETVKYHILPVLLLNELKKIKKEVKELKKEIHILKKNNRHLPKLSLKPARGEPVEPYEHKLRARTLRQAQGERTQRISKQVSEEV